MRRRLTNAGIPLFPIAVVFFGILAIQSMRGGPGFLLMYKPNARAQFLSDQKEIQKLEIRGVGTIQEQLASELFQQQPSPTATIPTDTPEGERTGAICSDGSTSVSIGSGACASHGGVAEWLYSAQEDEPDQEPEPIAVTNYGFGQAGGRASYAFIVENPNTELAFERSQYQAAAYDENGIVLDTESGYINRLLPGQALGIGGEFHLDEGTVLDTIEVQVRVGEHALLSGPIPLFSYENVNYVPDDSVFSAGRVTGIVVSPYNTVLTDLRVSAIAYDENGTITGGGYNYLEFLPANGKAAIEVSVTVTGTPSTVELYATVTSLSGFESESE